MYARKWCVTVVAVVLMPANGMAGNHYEPAHHFSVNLPDDWIRMPQYEVDYFNKLESRPPGIKYILGYKHRDSDADRFPIVLIHRLPASIRGMDQEGLKKALAKDLKTSVVETEGSILNAARKLHNDSVGLDREKGRVVFGAGLDRVQSNVNVLTIGYLEVDGVLVVQSYAPERDVRKWIPEIEQIHESFRFDNGHSFDPSNRRSLQVRIGELIIATSVFVILIIVVRALIRRQRRRATPDHIAGA